MPSINICKAIPVKYESTEIEVYLEEQLGKNRFHLGLPNLCYEKRKKLVHIVRKTDIQNKNGHFMTYGLSAKELIMNCNHHQCEGSLVESIGLSTKDFNFDLQEYTIKNRGRNVELETQIIVPNTEDIIFTKEKHSYSPLNLSQFIDKLIELYIEGGYTVRDYDIFFY